MKGIRGIVFDCDGVLFESRQANLAFYNAVLSHFGRSPVDAEDPALAHLCHTAASPAVFSVLLGPEQIEEATAYAATLDVRQFLPHMIPEPDLHSTLENLSARLPLAVATNRGGSMPEILRHFGLSGYFRAVVTSRDVSRPKPFPDMVILAARRLSMEPAEILFVGDSELDREAAKSAGARFAAYRWGGRGDGDIRIEGHRDLAALLLGGGEAIESVRD